MLENHSVDLGANMLTVTPRQSISLLYPESTLICDRSVSSREFRPRMVSVVEVRDLLKEPLEPRDYLRRPMIHRARYLIRAAETVSQPREQRQTRRFRQFYLHSRDSESNLRSCPLRIGLFENSKMVEILARPFYPTKRDRQVLAKLLIELLNDDFGDRKLGVFADDLRLVSDFVN